MLKLFRIAGLCAAAGFLLLAPLPQALAKGPLSSPDAGASAPAPEASPVLKETAEDDGKTDKEVERQFEEGGSPLSYSKENPKPLPKS